MASARPRVAVLGAGSASERLCELTSGDLDLVVFEPGLVGGECPHLACMPSKAMLHVSRTTGDWDAAVAHREHVTGGRDDSDHVQNLIDLGVDLRRSAARVVGPNRVESDAGDEIEVDHIVIATGAEPIVPAFTGDDDTGVAERVWTSADVYRATERPDRVVILGGGVIGHELADLFVRVGTEVVVVDRGDRSFESFPPAVARVVSGALEASGVDLRYGVEVAAVRRVDGSLIVELSDDSVIEAVDRLVVAAGRRPRTSELGLESIGVDGSEPLDVGRNGALDAPGSVWVMGDAAGRGEYTHLANHHAQVVADHLIGSQRRHFDDVALAACVFTSPPLVRVGPTWADVHRDDDIVATEIELSDFPRAMTDRIDDGVLWLAARRGSGALVAAAGAGSRFDELVHALVIAVDARLPVAQLRQSLRPFPTLGEILGVGWDRLHDRLTG